VVSTWAIWLFKKASTGKKSSFFSLSDEPHEMSRASEAIKARLDFFID
jgi:hypothetical protein